MAAGLIGLSGVLGENRLDADRGLKIESALPQGGTWERGIAQSGSAPALGAGGRGFESLYPDHRAGSAAATRSLRARSS